MKRGLSLLLVMIVLMGGNSCSNEHPDNKPPEAAIKPYRVGDSIYVCGCPMLCCNSLSRNPKGRCACNEPLRRGTISMIQKDKIKVMVGGREKIFFLPAR